MQRDHKLGLALGVLLVGFASALCFPRPSPTDRAEAELANTSEIDADIAHLPVRPYTPPPEPELPKLEPEPEPPEPGRATERSDPPAAIQTATLTNGRPDGIGLSPGAPEPIRVTTSDGETDPLTPLPVPDESVFASTGAAVELSPDLEPVHSPPPANASTDERPLQKYTVRPGDTLSSIAARFLGKSRRFLDIYEANRDLLASPDDLQSGMVLTIPGEPPENPKPDADDRPIPNAPPETQQPTDETSRHPARPGSRFRPAGTPPFIPRAPRSSQTQQKSSRDQLPPLKSSPIIPAPENNPKN